MKQKRFHNSKPGYIPISPLVADHQGKIFELNEYAALGSIGFNKWSPLTQEDVIPMPYGSELMFLKDRSAVLYHIRKKQIEIVDENPYEPGTPLYPVAVFNSPGFAVTHGCPFIEHKNASLLPLFSYGACGFSKNKIVTASVQVDWEKRQDLRKMPVHKVKTGIETYIKQMPENRLRRHLEKCALTYSCPAAKNFFIGRCEAPLPTSRHCNARCIGCLSLQSNSGMSCSQQRISFTPSPEEIAEIALAHFRKVHKPVVSFGQGCEGDPILESKVIESAIQIIRHHTSKGTINLNTNASLPKAIESLFKVGLDSMRVSINSFQPHQYHAYFRPASYQFEDVIQSIDIALRLGKHVSLNYLHFPGVTDHPHEVHALTSFLKKYPIHLIQWRNLNIDPLIYYQAMQSNTDQQLEHPMGIRHLIQYIQSTFPNIKHGYFNPFVGHK